MPPLNGYHRNIKQAVTEWRFRPIKSCCFCLTVMQGCYLSGFYFLGLCLILGIYASAHKTLDPRRVATRPEQGPKPHKHAAGSAAQELNAAVNAYVINITLNTQFTHKDDTTVINDGMQGVTNPTRSQEAMEEDVLPEESPESLFGSILHTVFDVLLLTWFHGDSVDDYLNSLLGVALCGLLSTFLLFIGLCRGLDYKKYLLPYVLMMVFYAALSIGHFISLCIDATSEKGFHVHVKLSVNQIKTIVIIDIFFSLIINIINMYTIVCIVSQYYIFRRQLAEKLTATVHERRLQAAASKVRISTRSAHLLVTPAGLVGSSLTINPNVFQDDKDQRVLEEQRQLMRRTTRSEPMKRRSFLPGESHSDTNLEQQTAVMEEKPFADKNVNQKNKS